VSGTAQPLAYTDAEVSSLLRVSKRTVYRLRKSGMLPAVRIGRAVRIPAWALAEFLSANSHTNPTSDGDGGTFAPHHHRGLGMGIK
jgi:excisionase family DNA binding protein